MGFQNGFSERVFRTGVQNGCSERVFKTGVQNGCSEWVFRMGVQIFFFRMGVQNGRCDIDEMRVKPFFRFLPTTPSYPENALSLLTSTPTSSGRHRRRCLSSLSTETKQS